MKVKIVLTMIALIYSATVQVARAQGQAVTAPPLPAAQGVSRPKPIQDNSFLIEEAYNQEAGVIQHISAFMRQRNGDWVYTFTEEWPVASQKHQLSFTIPILGLGPDSSGRRGVGDLALNYRYQLLGSGDAPVAISPRVSLLLPTGDKRMGRGAGGAGIQLNLPVSIQPSRSFVTHSNAGLTVTPSASNARNEVAALRDFNLGQSLIWLARPNLNLLVEALWESKEAVVGMHRRHRKQGFLLNPGLRWAHNFKSGLQIVPGVGLPIGLGPSRGERGFFFYVSFEHPLSSSSGR